MEGSEEMTLTDDDKQHLHEEYQYMLADEEDYDGPETVMVSCGYVDLWIDGDVVAHGRTIWNVEEG
jgi:hypothetical protein